MTFQEYVAQRGDTLLRFAHVLTGGDAHSAQDLTQTTLVDVYRHWRRVSAARNTDAYVRHMMVNAHLRRGRLRSSTEVPAEQQDRGATVADPADEVAARDETRRLLARLPPRARTILVLRYYADLDDNAIADVLRISPSTVRATASRALAGLRDKQTLGNKHE
ncbi:SigE family RNA polymerase sigma factor [Actinoplanes sp. RD1]|uniref:SigE family RNA polymerase sigma factor n=1 Tax=Actinoplanes sp. RD1 TaxID=3064538 RepID=UPI002742913C|nr:SigE family RNA polymerase sigma factor [Actinoplanes sp. RD1]